MNGIKRANRIMQIHATHFCLKTQSRVLHQETDPHQAILLGIAGIVASLLQGRHPQSTNLPILGLPQMLDQGTAS